METAFQGERTTAIVVSFSYQSKVFTKVGFYMHVFECEHKIHRKISAVPLVTVFDEQLSALFGVPSSSVAVPCDRLSS